MARKDFLRKYQLHLTSLAFALLIILGFLVSAFLFYETPDSSRDTWLIQSMDRVNGISIDIRQKLRGPERVNSDLALIAIDNESVSEIGQWPWSRAKITRVIEELFKYGAKAVAVDIMLSEPSNTEIIDWIEQVKESNSIESDQFKRAKEKFDVDSRLSEIVAKYSKQLVMGVTYEHRRRVYQPYQEYCYKLAYEKQKSFSVFETEGFDFFMSDSSFSDSRNPPIAVENFLRDKLAGKMNAEEFAEYCSKWLDPNSDPHWQTFLKHWGSEPDVENFKRAFLWPALYPVENWLTNYNKLSHDTRFSGFLNTHQDLDGTVRRAQILVRSGELIMPSLSLRTAMLSLGAEGGQIFSAADPTSPVDLAINGIQLTDEDGKVLKSVRSDKNSRFFIKFAGRKFSYPHVTIRDLLDIDRSTLRVKQRVWDESSSRWQLDRSGLEVNKRQFLRGKTVVLGATAIGLYDLRVTPFDENIPGAEVHLNIMDNIIDGDGYLRSSQEAIAMYLLILISGLLIACFVVYFPNYISAILTLILVSGVFYYDFHYLFLQGTVTAIWIFLLLSACTFFGVAFFDHFISEKKRRELRQTFESYVSPSIVNEVMAHPENIKLGGRKVHMSVFFSDVRGFTTISERLAPEELSEVLNLYLTPMTSLVFENNGTLDKYMGDAVMAFFGAPIPYERHAESACRCALESIERLKEVNSELSRRGFPNLSVGIGVNTGPMSVGNMGSETVRSYTVMGDAVNLGSRLEGVNKQYGTQIIISEFTERELGKNFSSREIDLVQVKGKNKPVKIFELLGEGPLSNETQQLVETYNRGLADYHERKWQSALEFFEQCWKMGADQVSMLYIERCREYIEHPPDKDWDGVFVMRTK